MPFSLFGHSWHFDQISSIFLLLWICFLFFIFYFFPIPLPISFRVFAMRGSDNDLELLMSEMLCRRKYYMSVSQKGMAEVQRSTPLQNRSVFEEKVLMLSPKLWREDTMWNTGTRLNFTPFGEEGECNSHSLLSWLGITAEVMLTAPLTPPSTHLHLNFLACFYVCAVSENA